MKKKVISIWVCLAMTSALLTGCSTYDSFRGAFFRDRSAKEETIRIAVLEPQTGDDREFGKYEIRGIELANELVKEVLNKKIELIYADTQSSIYSVESAVQDLISKKPALILGTYGEAVALVAGRQLRKVKLPAIGITNTNPLITGGNEYYFTVAFSEASQGRALAHFAFEKLKMDCVGIIKLKGDDAASEMVTVFTRTLTKLTEKRSCVRSEVEIDPAKKNYTDALQKIKDSGVRTVFVPTSLKIAESVFETADRLDMNDVIFVGTKEWHDEKLLKLKEKFPTIKMVVVSDVLSDRKSASAAEEATEQYKRFIKAYEEKYGVKEPPEAAALAFDAYMLAVRAIESAGSTDGKAVREALANTENYSGVSGVISFNERGEPCKSINIDFAEAGSFRSVYTVNRGDTTETQDEKGES